LHDLCEHLGGIILAALVALAALLLLLQLLVVVVMMMVMAVVVVAGANSVAHTDSPACQGCPRLLRVDAVKKVQMVRKIQISATHAARDCS